MDGRDSIRILDSCCWYRLHRKNTRVLRPATMSKRPLDVESKPRKRFVWPDSLHRAFIGAVLEVGLDASTPKQISDVLPNRGDGSATLDQIKAQIHKLRLYRSTVRVISASVRMLYFI